MKTRSIRRRQMMGILASILFFSAFVVAQATSTSSGLTLAKLEAMALQHNPTVGEAESAVQASAGQVRQVGLWPNPTIGYSAGRLRGGYVRGGDQGLFIQQSILLGGKLAAAQATARAVQAREQVLATAQRTAVLSAVRVAYYHSLAAQERVAVEEQLAKLAADAARTTRQLGNVGQADQPDELQAEVEAGQAQLRLEQARFQQQQAWSRLAAVTGQPGLPLQKLEGSLEQTLPSLNTGTYLQDLLARSPAVQVAEAAQKQAEAQLHQQKRQAIPNLFVRAGLADGREISDLRRSPTGLQGSAEIGVNLPVFNRNQGNIATASAEIERSTLELQRVRLRLRAQAAPVLAGYASALHTVIQYRQSLLPKAKQAWQLYRKSYQQMAAAYPQVLIAQRTWFQLQGEYVNQLETLWVDATSLQGFLVTDGLNMTTGGIAASAAGGWAMQGPASFALPSSVPGGNQ